MNLYHLKKSHIKNIAWVGSFGLMVTTTTIFGFAELSQGEGIKNNSTNTNAETVQYSNQNNHETNGTILGEKSTVEQPAIEPTDSSHTVYDFSSTSETSLPFNIAYSLPLDLQIQKSTFGDIFSLHKNNSDTENNLENAVLIIEAYQSNRFTTKQGIMYAQIKYYELNGLPVKEYTKTGKEEGVEVFYPDWMYSAHKAVEIRAGENSSNIYMLSFNPEYEGTIFEDLMNSVRVWE